jgi:hypothetical protein
MSETELKQRAFILSSFRRLEIPISTFVYRFADKIIRENWSPHLGKLEEVDQQIKEKYTNFLNSGHF